MFIHFTIQFVLRAIGIHIHIQRHRLRFYHWIAVCIRNSVTVIIWAKWVFFLVVFHREIMRSTKLMWKSKRVKASKCRETKNTATNRIPMSSFTFIHTLKYTTVSIGNAHRKKKCAMIQLNQCLFCCCHHRSNNEPKRKKIIHINHCSVFIAF